MPGLIDSGTEIVIAGINCYDEGTEEQFGRQGATATRTIVCAWGDRIALAVALAGGLSGTGPITSLEPAQQYPDATIMYVDGVKPVGVGEPLLGPNGMIAYPWARLTVTYKSPNLSSGGGGTGSFQLDFGGDVLCAPQDESVFQWKSDGKDITPEASPSLSIATAQIIIPQKDLPKLRERSVNILALVDNVNNEEFLGAAIGTILYKGASSLARQVGGLDGANYSPGSGSSEALEAFDLQHRFLWRRVPWNYFLRPSTGEWEEIEYIYSSKPYFPKSDLSQILEGPTPPPSQ